MAEHRSATILHRRELPARCAESRFATMQPKRRLAHTLVLLGMFAGSSQV